MSPCIEWNGARHRQGYGNVKRNGRTELAHRVAYAEAHGPIPEGMHVLHRCDHPPCVNLEHLFLGTHIDNMRDRDAKGRTRLPPVSRGEACAWARLSASSVALIRWLADCGVRQRLIATSFGVSQTLVSRIRLRKVWAHVPDLIAPGEVAR